MISLQFNFKCLLASLFFVSSMSTNAYAQTTNLKDPALIVYFNQLYKVSPPKCSIDDITKVRIVSPLEPKCLVRSTIDGQSFISGYQPNCSESLVKQSVDTEVNSICNNRLSTANNVTKAQAAAAIALNQPKAAGAGPVAGSKTLSAEYKSMQKKVDKISDVAENPDKYMKKIDGVVQDVKSAGNTVVEKGRELFSGGSSPAEKTDAGSVASNASAPTAAPSTGSVQPISNPTAGDATVIENNTPAPSTDVAVNANEPLTKEAVGKMEETTKQTLGEANKVAPSAPAEVAAPAVAVAAGTAEGVAGAATAATQTATEAAAAAEAAFSAKINAALTTAQSCIGGPAQGMVAKIQAAVTARDAVKAVCSKSNSAANFLCPITTNPSAVNVQKLMVAGAAALSNVTAASESCKTTSTISKVAQAGMLLGQLTCATSKLACDTSCAQANSQKVAILNEMQAAIAAIEAQTAMHMANFEATGEPSIFNAQLACESAELAMASATELLVADGASVTAKIMQCQAHAANMALMATSAIGFLASHKDAEKCKQQLAAGSGSSTANGVAGPQISTAEFCGNPANAASTVCKCTANPNADGCMGSLAKTGFALGKTNSNGGLSSLASANTNGLNNLNASVTDTAIDNGSPQGGLSDAARDVLGLPYGAGNAPTNASGGFGGGSSGSSAAGKANVAAGEDSKRSGGLLSTLGSFFGGGSAAKKGPASKVAEQRKFAQDQAIKRKIASDKVRAEISTASGKSNFDKIKSRYQSFATSFEN